MRLLEAKRIALSPELLERVGAGLHTLLMDRDSKVKAAAKKACRAAIVKSASAADADHLIAALAVPDKSLESALKRYHKDAVAARAVPALAVPIATERADDDETGLSPRRVAPTGETSDPPKRDAPTTPPTYGEITSSPLM